MEARWILYTLGFLVLVMVLLQTQRAPYTLPKIVWTHWDSETPPPYVTKNIEKMRRTLPDWEVRMITTDQFLSSINQEEIPAGFQNLKVEHQADWIRMKLLKRYGGCWIDSGIILNQSINSLYRDCVSNRADLLVFTIKDFQTDSRYPIAENWFLMAPPESPMISLWLDEYERSIRMGFKRYKQHIRDEGVDLQNLMKRSDDVYLIQHGCYQKVIQQRKPPNAKIVYHPAEESMYKIHVKLCKWDKQCIQAKLQDVAYCKTLPYIKLRGTDRKNLNILPLLD